MSKNKTAVWKPFAYQGMEILYLEENENLIQANSVVLGVENQQAFRLDYVVNCDNGYIVREVNFLRDVHTPTQKHVFLQSDGLGNWLNEKLNPLPELDGCIDVDISATPFTNTLPIRRIQWQVGRSEVFNMVYILVPDLTVSVMRQRYTCLAKTDQGATFRYENVDDDFKAIVNVDQDGLVTHYEGLFERVI